MNPNNPLNLPPIPDTDEAAQRILKWIRNGHKSFSRSQVAGLHIARTSAALDRLELHGYLQRDVRLKRYHARPRVFEEGD